MGNCEIECLHRDWLVCHLSRSVPGTRFFQPVGRGKVGGRAVLAQARAGVAHKLEPQTKIIARYAIKARFPRQEKAASAGRLGAEMYSTIDIAKKSS